MSQQAQLDIEDTTWPHHPSNQPYRGTANSTVQDTSTNDLETFEAIVLEIGESKIVEKIDTRTPNTSIFTINKEDHTLGNLLRAKLLSNQHVKFSAYRVPHPMFPTIELRCSTDGQITPKEALIGACRDTIQELGVIDREFTRAVELRRMADENKDAQ